MSTFIPARATLAQSRVVTPSANANHGVLECIANLQNSGQLPVIRSNSDLSMLFTPGLLQQRRVLVQPQLKQCVPQAQFDALNERLQQLDRNGKMDEVVVIVNNDEQSLTPLSTQLLQRFQPKDNGILMVVNARQGLPASADLVVLRNGPEHNGTLTQQVIAQTLQRFAHQEIIDGNYQKAVEQTQLAVEALVNGQNYAPHQDPGSVAPYRHGQQPYVPPEMTQEEREEAGAGILNGLLTLLALAGAGTLLVGGGVYVYKRHQEGVLAAKTLAEKIETVNKGFEAVNSPIRMDKAGWEKLEAGDPSILQNLLEPRLENESASPELATALRLIQDTLLESGMNDFQKEDFGKLYREFGVSNSAPDVRKIAISHLAENWHPDNLSAMLAQAKKEQNPEVLNVLRNHYCPDPPNLTLWNSRRCSRAPFPKRRRLR